MELRLLGYEIKGWKEKNTGFKLVYHTRISALVFLRYRHFDKAEANQKGLFLNRGLV